MSCSKWSTGWNAACSMNFTRGGHAPQRSSLPVARRRSGGKLWYVMPHNIYSYKITMRIKLILLCTAVRFLGLLHPPLPQPAPLLTALAARQPAPTPTARRRSGRSRQLSESSAATAVYRQYLDYMPIQYVDYMPGEYPASIRATCRSSVQRWLHTATRTVPRRAEDAC